MERHISGVPTAEFLWNSKKVIPFRSRQRFKDSENGVRLMKNIPDLRKTLEKARVWYFWHENAICN